MNSSTSNSFMLYHRSEQTRDQSSVDILFPDFVTLTGVLSYDEMKMPPSGNRAYNRHIYSQTPSLRHDGLLFYFYYDQFRYAIVYARADGAWCETRAGAWGRTRGARTSGCRSTTTIWCGTRRSTYALWDSAAPWRGRSIWTTSPARAAAAGSLRYY